MDERTINNDEIEIDLQRLLGALINKAWLMVISAILGAVLAFCGTFFFVTPQYQSSAMFYVNNNSLSLGEASLSISSADISASRGLVKTYIVILNTREALNDVIDYAGVNLNYGQLKSMISAEAVDSTEIFKVVVTSPDPSEAEKIADAITYILPKRISSIIEGTSAKIVDSAVLPSAPSSPNYTKNTMLGFAIGLVLMAALVVLRELLDITLRNEDDISKVCAHPILASVPDMHSSTRGGYGKRRRTVKPVPKDAKPTELVGSKLSFAAAESYKLLRTKLQFSFAEEAGCRIIGVSSALHGEGKSLTSVNLAHSMSQLGKRVLLIDCDMRKPSVHEKLPVKKAPGLSDFLSGQIGADQLIQVCALKEDERAFHVISAGHTPPNPMELLSSARMGKMVELLSKSYDYIFFDLPPVGEVSDAMAAGKLAHGMLIVVRQDYGDRVALASAVRQFEFVGTRILGLVFNCVAEDKGMYGSKYYKYYRRYYRRSDKEYNAYYGKK